MYSDIQYSATAGAVFEAAFQSFHAIAVSEGADSCHEVTDAYLREILTALMERSLSSDQIWNVNFPSCPLADCKGILWDCKVSRGMIYRDHYKKLEELPDGSMRLMVEGVPDWEAEEETDLRTIRENYISMGCVNNVG